MTYFLALWLRRADGSIDYGIDLEPVFEWVEQNPEWMLLIVCVGLALALYDLLATKKA